MSRLSFAGAMTAAGLMGLAWTAPAAAQELTTPPAAEQAQPSAYTDAQLQAFVAASVEIEPLNQQLGAAAPDARAGIGQQIVAVLDRHGLDLATYNGIVAAAQADAALAQRLAALRPTTQPPA